MRRRPFRRFSKKRATTIAMVAVLWLFWWLFAPIAKNSSIEDSEFAKPEFTRDVLRICTWNVHNYNVSSRRVRGNWINYPKPENERNEIASILSKIDADVVLLQEMGDITYLKDLCERLKNMGKGYPYAFVSVNDVPSRLAILSKVKPEKVFDFSDTRIRVKGEPLHSPRGTLGIKINVKGKEFYAFSIHLKSKVNAKKKDENFMPFRFAELRAIGKRVNSVINDNSMLIYGGDFNDEPTPRFLRNLGDVNVVKQADKFGDVYTYHWRKKNIFFKYDYFVVSPKLAELIKNNAVVVGKSYASDHRAVYVDIVLDELKNKKDNL